MRNGKSSFCSSYFSYECCCCDHGGTFQLPQQQQRQQNRRHCYPKSSSSALELFPKKALDLLCRSVFCPFPFLFPFRRRCLSAALSYPPKLMMTLNWRSFLFSLKKKKRLSFLCLFLCLLLCPCPGSSSSPSSFPPPPLLHHHRHRHPSGRSC